MKMENLPDELLINILYQTDLPIWWVLKHVSRRIRDVVLSEAEYAIRTGKSIMKDPDMTYAEFVRGYHCGGISWIGRLAAKCGYLGIMPWITKYQMDNPDYFLTVASGAAAGGDMNILYNAVKFCTTDGIDLTKVLHSAVRNGQIRAMEYICDKMGLETYPVQMYCEAAEGGQVDLFLHLWEQQPLWGLEIVEHHPNNIAIIFSESSVRLYHSITKCWGKTGDPSIYEELENKKILKMDNEHLVHGAIESGNISAVKYLLQFQDLKYISDSLRYYTSSVMDSMINSESIEMINFIRELSDYQIDKYICSHAVKCAKLNILIWAHENGMPWNDDMLIDAARSGSIECLRYAHENGCDLNHPESDLFMTAVQGNNIECIKYVHEQMYPEFDFHIAQLYLHFMFDKITLDVFVYLYEKCEYDIKELVNAILQYDRDDLLQFLHVKGMNTITLKYNRQLDPDSKCAKYLASKPVLILKEVRYGLSMIEQYLSYQP